MPRIRPIKTTKGSEKTIFRIGDGAIGFIPKSRNKTGNKLIITLRIPNAKETTAFPLGSGLDW